MPVFLDVLILAVLLLYIVLGSHRGFVLTLCSLVAVVVAFVGASFLADAAAPKVAEFLQPKLAETLQETLSAKAEDLGVDWADDLVDFPSETLAALKEKGGIYKWAANGLEQTGWSFDGFIVPEDGGYDGITRFAYTIAYTVAERLARNIIFGAAFLLILVLWFFLSHALDLVAKLPVLTDLNRALGGAMGFIKGLVVVWLAVWVLVHLTGFISPETVSATKILKFLTEHSPLDLLLLV